MTAASVRAVVFDLGAVVFRWRPARVMQQALPQRSMDDAQALAWAARVFGAPGGAWAEFDRGTLDVPELVLRLVQDTGLSSAEAHALVGAALDELQPLADTEALIARLHDAGMPLFYLSNMPAPYAAHLVAQHAVMGRFGDGVFSSHVGSIKPEQDIFDIAAGRFGVPPQQLLFLDDNAANVAAARALGWQALQFHDAAQAAVAMEELLK